VRTLTYIEETRSKRSLLLRTTRKKTKIHFEEFEEIQDCSISDTVGIPLKLDYGR